MCMIWTSPDSIVVLAQMLRQTRRGLSRSPRRRSRSRTADQNVDPPRIHLLYTEWDLEILMMLRLLVSVGTPVLFLEVVRVLMVR